MHVDGQLAHIRAEIAKSGAVKGSGGKGGGGGRGKLITAKECPVGKLRDDSTLAEFKHWTGQVELHLDNERRLEKQRGERLDALLSHACVPGFADVAFQSRTTYSKFMRRYCSDIAPILTEFRRGKVGADIV